MNLCLHIVILFDEEYLIVNYWGLYPKRPHLFLEILPRVPSGTQTDIWDHSREQVPCCSLLFQKNFSFLPNKSSS